MIGRVGLLRIVPWIAILATLATGCVHVDAPLPIIGDVADLREERTATTREEFEAKRTTAEIQAALAAWNQGNPQACKEGLRGVLLRNPNHRDAQLLLAEVYQVEGRHEEASALLQEAVLARPNDPVVHYATATLLQTVGESQGALAYYAKAADLEPGNQVYAAAYQTALQAAGSSDNVALVSPDRSPTDMGPPGREPFVASTDPPEGTPIDPVQSLLDQGRRALAEDRGDLALEYFDQAAATSPDNPQILITAVMMTMREERPDLAVRLLQPAQQHYKSSAQFYQILGTAQYRLGDYESSQVSLRQALSLDKSNALSYFLLGCTLSKLGEFESAEVHLRQAGTIDSRFAAQ